jgi:hypothetical protein
METSNQHFGLVIAYLLPGFISLGGIALLIPSVAGWLRPEQTQAGLGPPVYTVLAAIAVGMIVSCIRWLIIDQILWMLGVIPPTWDGALLQQRLGVFNYFVEYHYRYYQFYANTLVAIAWTYSLNRWLHTSAVLGVTTDVAVVTLCAVLFAGSRDALSKYYSRTAQVVGDYFTLNPTGDLMTNGCHRDQAAPPTSHKGATPKGADKPTPKREPEKKSDNSRK